MSDVNRLLSALGSPYWWLTAVVLASRINLVSSCLKPVIDRWLDLRSKRRKAAFERDVAQTRLWAKFLLQDGRLLDLEETRLIVGWIKALVFATLLAADLVGLYVLTPKLVSSAPWVL